MYKCVWLKHSNWMALNFAVIVKKIACSCRSALLRAFAYSSVFYVLVFRRRQLISCIERSRGNRLLYRNSRQHSFIRRSCRFAFTNQIIYVERRNAAAAVLVSGTKISEPAYTHRTRAARQHSLRSCRKGL